MEKKRIKGIGIITAVFFAVIAIISVNVGSQPSGPNTVAGYIFDNDSAGAENGIPVRINNTNLSQMFYTEVYAPPVPQLEGIYSASINGSEGHYILVRSYNDTTYGETQGVLGSSTTRINVTLNITRPSETNISILWPNDDDIFNTSQLINVSINISVSGSTGQDCNVTLSVNNETVFSFPGTTNRTNPVGAMSLGQIYTTSFEVLANKSGTANISARGECSTDGINFEGLNLDNIFNVIVNDSLGPVVKLINPGNNTVNKSMNTIQFQYNVTDPSLIQNCTLYIDGVQNQTNSTVQKDGTQNFTHYLENGEYNWNVNCSDEYGNTGDSGLFFFNVSVYYPNILSQTNNQTIMLNAGGTKKTECNLTVEDGNGAIDIYYVNASYHTSSTSASDTDNGSKHYTNESCYQTASGGNLSNYTCTFDVYYFAENGTWYCNATVEDLQSLQANNSTTFNVDPLYALNTSAAVIDYGNVAAGQSSGDESLSITNFGNMPLNISVRGYGGDDPVAGDNLAMMCVTGVNISVDNERYSIQPGIVFGSKTQLTSMDVDLGLTVQKQTDAGQQKTNASYWELYVPPMQVTQCNGTIVFTAQAP